jgi:hypothetical protein
MLDWHATVQLDGYGLVPSVFAEDEVLSLLKKLDGENLKRTRAGARHAMRSDQVALMAQDARMLEMAKRILGTLRSHFGRRCSRSCRSRTGLWPGIKTLHYRSASTATLPVGDPGRFKTA